MKLSRITGSVIPALPQPLTGARHRFGVSGRRALRGLPRRLGWRRCCGRNGREREAPVDDKLRLDLSDFDKDYIEEMLDTFLDNAGDRGRKLTEIRMSRPMSEMLGIEKTPEGRAFRGVPVIVAEAGSDGTIEVILTPLH
jgi:hypothetical protein